MKPVSEIKHCAECGSPLPAYWPKGLCAQCALDGALDMSHAGSQVHQPKPPNLTPDHQPSPSSAGSSPLGSFGDYDLLDEVARGGMGVVYKARQRNLGRIVAVKMILAGPLAGKDFVRRFRTESAAAAILQHPNIVAIHDVGVHEGRHYFSMDYVESQSLSQLVGQQPLPPAKAARYVELIAEAIHYAHEQGILHRDLKPSNVLIDANDQPRVTDFGLAKKLDTESSLTISGQVLGSPNFMPPEQAGGGRGKVGRPSDVYALGGILYYLLTARAPFQAESLEGIITQVLNVEPVSPRLLNLSIPKDLETITLKCLEKEPARRYQTAQELADELSRFLRHEPIHARPLTPPEKLWRWGRRNPVLALLIVLLHLVGAVGLTGIVWQWRRAEHNAKSERQQREGAEVQEVAARRRAYASDINLAQQALALNNLGRAQELLDRQRPESTTPNSQLSTDLRGWEWRYLWRQCQSDALFTLCQESGQIVSLSVSAGGKWMVVCGDWSGGLSIWDLQTRRAIVRLPAGKGQVRAVFSPRDSLLAFSVASGQSSTNLQYAIRLWNSETREIVAELPLAANCLGLAFSGDGRTLVTSTAKEQGQIALWRMPDGKKLASYPAPPGHMFADNSFAVALDASVSAYRMVEVRKLRVIDLANGQERLSAKASEQEGVQALALSSDGKILASGTGFTESTIRLWDVASKREINRLEGHRSYVGALMFWPDGKTLASGSGDQTIRLWDLSNPTNVPPPRVLRGHKDEVSQFTLLPDQTTLVSGCKDGSVCFWDTTSSRQQGARITVPGTFSSWRFAPESKSVVTLSRNGNVVRWKGASFQEIETLLDIGTNFVASRTLISADTRLLAAGSAQGRLRVWDLRQGVLLLEWTNGIAPQPFAFLADGKRLVTVDRGDGVHREWDLTTGKQTQFWQGAAELNWSCSPTISPDERWCLTLNSGGAGLIRDIITGSERNLNLNLDEVGGAAFSPNGKLFAATSGFGTARLWEATTLQAAATFRGTLQGVHSVAFSPDGKRLAIGSDGIEAIKIWDMESRQELLTLEGQGSVFNRTAFSPDGDVLGSMNMSGRLHLWRAPSWEEIAAAEAKEKMEIKQP